MRKTKEVLLWIVTIFVVFIFAKAGIRKFPDAGPWTQTFHRLGFSDSFRILIGVVETAGALLLVWPRTAAYGAIVNIAVMIGAIVAVISHGLLGWIAPPAAQIVFLSIVLIARWRQRLTISAPDALATQ